MADVCCHPAHLAIASLGDCQFKPASIRVALGVQWRLSLRQAGIRESTNLGWQCWSILERDPFTQSLQGVIAGLTFDLDTIGLGLLVLRMADAVNQFAVIAQQKQPLRVIVQAPGRIDARYVDHVGKSIPAFTVRELGQHTIGFVQ